MRVIVKTGHCRGTLLYSALTLALILIIAKGSYGQEDPFAPAGAESQTITESKIELQRRALHELREHLIPLLGRGKDDREAAAKASELAVEIAKREQLLKELMEMLQRKKGEELRRQEEATDATDDPFGPAARGGDNRKQQAVAALEASLAQTRAQLVEREQEVAELLRQLSKLERTRDLPVIQDGETKVFALVNVQAPEAAGTIESLFGAQLRVATDERSNALIVFGKADTVKAVEALLMRLDQKATSVDGQVGSVPSPQSLLLRIFWLADGLPEGEGEEPNEYLPAAVIKATERLGLDDPRLVAQTVNSLAVSGEGPVEFATSVPAVVFKQPAGLNCTGRMRAVVADRAGVDVQIQVASQSINCQLSGSLATPLGHYMVLGTANSVIADPATLVRMGMMGGYGGEGGGIYGGRGGEYGGGVGRPGGYGGGYGGPGRFGSPPRAEEAARRAEEGEMVVEGAAPPADQPAEPKYDSSRFAFVVQVIEGESYAAEE